MRRAVHTPVYVEQCLALENLNVTTRVSPAWTMMSHDASWESVSGPHVSLRHLAAKAILLTMLSFEL